MTTRQQRRAEARKLAKGGAKMSTTLSHTRDVDYSGMAPVPQIIGTKLGPYKYGGKSWVLIEVEQPNSTVHIVFAPEDARRFAEDMLKIVDKVELTTDPDEVAPSSEMPSGLIVTKEMPNG